MHKLDPIERLPDGTLFRLTPGQLRSVRGLTRRCCNFLDGDCLLLDGVWYKLTVKEEIKAEAGSDPVKSLDVSILQDYLLGPVLGIQDPKTDRRIGFIGGIRGLSELERRTNEDMRAAFSMYPTSIQELLAVADAGRLMPPKSTWFEPKLRSGLFIHML